MTTPAMRVATTLYQRMPPKGRSLMASARGLQLRHQRYGPDTEALVAEVLERDHWSADQWRTWQHERLGHVLERARFHVPAYRRHWDGSEMDWRDLASWPTLEKAELRSANDQYVADDLSHRSLIHDHTSGTTGASLDIWLHRDTVRLWYAMSEARWRRWYGVSLDDRWAIVGGQLVVPVQRRTPPYWVWNQPLNQLYLSSYHLDDRTIGAYLDELVRRRIRYILAYPSSVYALARHALRHKRRDVDLHVVITNAEPLYDHQRDAISAAFGCPVRETYGMSEAVAAGSECEHGRMHLWPDAGIVEIDQPTGVVGDIVATGLVNADMPLIRYRVGDRAALLDEQCPCGRTLPLIGAIDGRSDDVLYTREGRPVGRLDPVFKAGTGVAEAQIVQTAIDRLLVRYVPDPDSDTTVSEQTISAALRDRMGDMAIDFEPVAAIERTASGKFRAVVCALPEEARRLLIDHAEEPDRPHLAAEGPQPRSS